MIYIASPFTDPSVEVMQTRWRAATLFNFYLIKTGKIAISPIALCYPMVQLIPSTPVDFETWASFNLGLLSRSRELRVLMLPGWQESFGVAAETRFAKENSIPVVYSGLPEESFFENL